MQFFFTLILLFSLLDTQLIFAQYQDTIYLKDVDDYEVIGAHVYLVDVNGKIDSNYIRISDQYGRVIFPQLGIYEGIYVSSIQYKNQSFNIHSIRANKGQIKLQTGYLKTIEVIGKGTSQEKIPLSEIPNQITLIDDKEIKILNPQTSADILTLSGDVFVQKSQMGGGSPIIRGFEANKILLVVDGVRMNNAIYRSGHLQNAISIDNAAIENIEVHHGPGSVMYGSDALGGVIHYNTKTPKFRSGDLKAYSANFYSRFSTANLEGTIHGDVNIGNEKFASFTSVTYSAYQNLRAGRIKSSQNMAYHWNRYFFVERIDTVDVALVNENPNVQVGTQYAQLDAIQKLRFKLSEKVELNFNLQYSTTSDVPRYDQLTEGDVQITNGQISGQTFKYAEWYYGPQQRLFTSLSAKVNQNRGLLFDNLNLIAAFQKIDEDRINRKFNDNLRRIQEEDVYVFSLNADFIKKFFKKDQIYSRLLYGAELTHNYVFSMANTQNIETGLLSGRSLGTRYPDGGSSMTTAGLYASYKQRLNNNTYLLAGIRYAFAYLDATYIDTLLYKLPYSNISAVNNAITGSLALTADLKYEFYLKMVLSSSFRTPNIDDFGKIRSKGDIVTIPNPDIRPEQAINAELSLSKKFFNRILLSSSFFYTHLFDVILQKPTQINGSDSMYYDGSYKYTYSNINAGQARIWGNSTNLKIEFSNYFQLRTGINFTQGNEMNQWRIVAPLAHIPPIYGQLDLIYKRTFFQTRFNIRYNGAKNKEDYADDSAENFEKALPEGTPAWFTLNLYAMIQLSEQFSLNLAVENILDWHYRTYSSGVSAPGINVILCLRGKF